MRRDLVYLINSRSPHVTSTDAIGILGYRCDLMKCTWVYWTRELNMHSVQFAGCQLSTRCITADLIPTSVVIHSESNLHYKSVCNASVTFFFKTSCFPNIIYINGRQSRLHVSHDVFWLLSRIIVTFHDFSKGNKCRSG